MGKIWLTTDGNPPTSVLGLFSTRRGAEAYVAELIGRYSSGGRLQHLGEPLAKDVGVWELGLGPTIVERDTDQRIESLPGAWVVKVDESCRMVACSFSTELAPTHPSTTYRAGVHHICQAHAATPQGAFDAARR